MAIGLLAAVPSVFLFASSESLALSLLGYGLLSFSTTLAAPASLAGVQMLTPDRLRGVVTSLFLACTTFVGIGLGPPLIGFITDRLGGPQVLGQSLIVTVAFFGVVGAAVALASRQPFARTAAITSQEQLA
jgi:MFS family permease